MDPSSPSVGVWFPQWADVLAKAPIKPSDRRMYRRTIFDYLAFCKQSRQRATVKAAGGKIKVKRTRRSKVTDENILEFLKTERSAGEIAKKLGQLIPKRVTGLVGAGKVVLRKDGLKKFYTAK